MDPKNLLDFFPTGYKPRDSQAEIFKQLNSLFFSKKKFLIICAATGAGKSLYSRTFINTTSEPHEEAANMVKDYSVWKTDEFGNYINADDFLLFPKWGGTVLTVSKQLQQQYLKLFKDTQILMGKSNYQCKVDENFDVETAPCLFVPKLKFQCWNENKCPYYNSRNDSITSKFSALNYKMFLSLPDHVKNRQVLVCDEASELEEELSKQFSAKVEYSTLKFIGVSYKPLVHETHGRVLSWLNELIDNVEHVLGNLKNRKEQDKLNDTDKLKLKVCFQLQSQLKTVADNFSSAEYIIEKDAKRVLLTPLKVDALSHYIFDYADKIVLLSATIINPSHFAKSLGIKDYDYLEVPSTFPPEKSPIFCSKENKLNYKNLDDLLPTIAKQISQILEQHKNDKGIIHTTTLNITEKLQKLLKADKTHYSRLLFRESGVSNEELIKRHTVADYPSVIVTPSMTHGADLLDNLGRFAILCKAPYPNLDSKKIKKRFEEDKEGYVDQTLKTIIQTCGRTTRSADDYSTTYCLDGNIAKIILENVSKLPKYFIQRIK